jgi:hypothetical protein
MLYLVGEFDIHNDRLDTGDHTLLLKNTKENDVQNDFADYFNQEEDPRSFPTALYVYTVLFLV